jgi:hypothetical protein
VTMHKTSNPLFEVLANTKTQESPHHEVTWSSMHNLQLGGKDCGDKMIGSIMSCMRKVLRH